MQTIELVILGEISNQGLLCLNSPILINEVGASSSVAAAERVLFKVN